MAELKAVIFDQDGVLADTERDGHRVAFNRAFKEFDLDIEWDENYYGSLLKVGGGKERMKYDFLKRQLDFDIEEIIPQLHKRKTEIFMEMLEHGDIIPRPGVIRLLDEIIEADLKLAVCSTSNELAVNTLMKMLLGKTRKSRFNLILAGDVVNNKKPDPEIYQLALLGLGLAPENCLVVEDSQNGLRAAKSAGIKCLVTVNRYTQNEDLTEADLRVTSLGNRGKEEAVRLGGCHIDLSSGEITLKILKEIVKHG